MQHRKLKFYNAAIRTLTAGTLRFFLSIVLLNCEGMANAFSLWNLTVPRAELFRLEVIVGSAPNSGL